MQVNPEECAAAGIDSREVERIARGISRYARQAEKLGITVFGGSSGTLRFADRLDNDGDLILASLDGTYDGGDGAYRADENGLLRGEGA